MKTKFSVGKTTALILFIIIGFTACKKEDSSTTPTLTPVAKWNFDKYVEVYTNLTTGEVIKDSVYGSTGDYLDFRADNKVYAKIFGNYDTASYSISSGNLTITSSTSTDVYSITMANANTLTLYSNDQGSMDRIQTWYYLSK